MRDRKERNKEKKYNCKTNKEEIRDTKKRNEKNIYSREKMNS